VQHTRLKKHPGRCPLASDVIADLLIDHGAVIRQARVDLEMCADVYQDMGINNFLTWLMARHEKIAWMLRPLFAGDHG
jgi:starvation-inducible DNA-binding protein